MLGVIVSVAVLVIAYLIITDKKKIIRFYSDSCRYCIESQAEWDKFCHHARHDYEIMNVNTKAQCPKIRHLMEKYDVTSVPTIVKVSWWGSSTYKGRHRAHDYLKFASD